MNTQVHKDTVPGAIRVVARALIIEDGKLLVMFYRDEHGEWCVSPGGGISKLETLAEGLKREVHEELSIEVEPDDVVYVRELLGNTVKVRHGGLDEDAHQLEIFFRCRRRGEVRFGDKPDNFCTGFEWVALEDLVARNFYPTALGERLPADVSQGFQSHGNYLGDA
jgi:8-oxo-dGTP diphosphatase